MWSLLVVPAAATLGVCTLAKLVSLSISMASNNVNDFLLSLANETHTSRTQSQILLSRKLAERERVRRRAANIKYRMRRLARELQTAEISMAAIDDDVRRLTEAVNMGVDED